MTAWPYRVGGELLGAVQMAQCVVDFADTYRVDPRTVVMTPWGYPPLCVPPEGDPSGGGRLHPGMDLRLCVHPVFWVEGDTRRPLPGEHPWEWVLRVYLELRARRVIDQQGGWVNVLDGVVDLSRPADRARLERYRDGGFDPVLAKFHVARSDDLRFDEARLAAHELFEAHYSQHLWALEVERSEARLRVDAALEWVRHAPRLWVERVRAWREKSELLMASASGGHEDMLRCRAEFSEALDETRAVLRGLVERTMLLRAAVAANTKSWSEHHGMASDAIRASGEMWDAVFDRVEIGVAAVYARPGDPVVYRDLDRLLAELWAMLWPDADSAVVEVTRLDEDGRLYPPPSREEGGLDVRVGRERFRQMAPLPPLGVSSN